MDTQRHSKILSESHHAKKAMSPASSTLAVTANIGLKSRPLASSNQPVKYCPVAPQMTQMAELAPYSKDA